MTLSFTGSGDGTEGQVFSTFAGGVAGAGDDAGGSPSGIQRYVFEASRQHRGWLALRISMSVKPSWRAVSR
jgi:hypothetical protein